MKANYCVEDFLMKNKICNVCLLICLLIFADASGQSLALSGIYQGKDLYIKNPFAKNGVGFCVTQVHVNGELTRDEINSSAFAIDFNILGVEVGDPIEVIVTYKKGCTPLVLNPESIKPHSTFEISDIEVRNNILSWTATKESGSLPYIVEQFKWNKWVKTGEVQGIGTAESHTYKFELTPYSGENKVRVKQVDYSNKPRYSDAVTYEGKVSKVTFQPQKADDVINFSSSTYYEIFNLYGELIKTGYGKSVDVSNLDKGEYYLNYDSSFGETFRKK